MACDTESEQAVRKRLRVLFMHGLESGPGGTKDRYLRRHFQVLTPDMHVSIYRFSKSNSVVRNALRRPLFLGWAAGAAGSLLCFAAWHGPLVWLAWLGVFGSLLMAIRRPLARQGLATSLERCVAIQADAIREYRPDIVVGSSWGGAVALICVSRGIYSGPLLAVAPVPKLIFDRLGDADGQRCAAFCREMPADAVRRAVIVHGDQDEVVPLEHSRMLAAATGVELQVIPGGDHSLHYALVHSDDGEGTNDRLRQLVVEVAQRKEA
jgi:predicted alpha/beta-hydrolase family hydrolase